MGKVININLTKIFPFLPQRIVFALQVVLQVLLQFILMSVIALIHLFSGVLQFCLFLFGSHTRVTQLDYFFNNRENM